MADEVNVISPSYARGELSDAEFSYARPETIYPSETVYK